LPSAETSGECSVSSAGRIQPQTVRNGVYLEQITGRHGDERAVPGKGDTRDSHRNPGVETLR
jgi:hypothetical protein